MSQANLDLISRAMQAVSARPTPDYATVNELFAADHVFVPLGVVGDEVHGGRGYRDFMKDQTGTFATWEQDFEGAVDVSADKVLGVFTIRLRGSASGIEVEQRTWMVATVRNGRVARTEMYSSASEALDAVGLGE